MKKRKVTRTNILYTFATRKQYDVQAQRCDMWHKAHLQNVAKDYSLVSQQLGVQAV
jgi:hypothetical protein